MDGKIDIFTIMFLVLAVVIILKLRSVLGRRTGDDEARIDRKRERALERAQASAKNGSNDKVVALPRRDRPPAPGGPAEGGPRPCRSFRSWPKPAPARVLARACDRSALRRRPCVCRGRS